MKYIFLIFYFALPNISFGQSKITLIRKETNLVKTIKKFNLSIETIQFRPIYFYSGAVEYMNKEIFNFSYMDIPKFNIGYKLSPKLFIEYSFFYTSTIASPDLKNIYKHSISGGMGGTSIYDTYLNYFSLKYNFKKIERNKVIYYGIFSPKLIFQINEDRRNLAASEFNNNTSPLYYAYFNQKQQRVLLIENEIGLECYRKDYKMSLMGGISFCFSPTFQDIYTIDIKVKKKESDEWQYIHARNTGMSVNFFLRYTIYLGPKSKM